MNAAARGSWRDRLAIVAGVGAVAVAAWLMPATVYIVRWTASGPTRVALFAPLPRLAGIAGLALLVLVGVFAWLRRDPARLARAAASIGPWSLLWLWSVPYVPWLADRVPLLLVLAGPIRWAFVVVALAMATGVSNRVAPLIDAVSRRVGRRTVFAVSLAAYLASGTLWARTIGIGGDEPHYLMIAQSLLADGDLLIENNHQNREYRAFFGSPLRPDFMVRGKDN